MPAESIRCRKPVMMMLRRCLKSGLCLLLTCYLAWMPPPVRPNLAEGESGLIRGSLAFAVQAIRRLSGDLDDGRAIITGIAGFLSRYLPRITAAKIYIDAGSTQSLLPAGPAADSPLRRAIWSSDRPSVAAVDQSGQIIARSAGVAIITAQTDSGSFLKIFTVFVSQKNAAVADGTYLFMISGNGLFLTADSDKVGSDVLAQPFDLFKYQRFRLENIGGGRFRIRAARSTRGLQLTLQTHEQMPAAGMEIDLMTDSAGWERQVWTATRHWNGLYSLISVADPTLALSTDSRPLLPSAVTLARCSPFEGQAQHWSLSPVSPVFAHEEDGCWPLAEDRPLSVWMWPVPSTTSLSGAQPVNAYNYSTVDIQQPDFDDTGALVLAAQSGYVTYRGLTGSFGMVIIIQSVISGTVYHAFYGNLINHYIPAWITVGSYVHQGDVIGRIGATGHPVGAHLTFGVKTGGTGITRSGTPLDPLTRIYKWNYQQDQPDLHLTCQDNHSLNIVMEPAGVDQTSLFLTLTILAVDGTSTDTGAQVARTIFSRLPVSRGSLESLIRTTGLVSLNAGQKYVLMAELEDLATGRSTCLYTDVDKP